MQSNDIIFNILDYYNDSSCHVQNMSKKRQVWQGPARSGEVRRGVRFCLVGVVWQVWFSRFGLIGQVWQVRVGRFGLVKFVWSVDWVGFFCQSLSFHHSFNHLIIYSFHLLIIISFNQFWLQKNWVKKLKSKKFSSNVWSKHFGQNNIAPKQMLVHRNYEPQKIRFQNVG